MLGKGILKGLVFFFVKDRPKGSPSANHHQPLIANHQSPPTTTNRQSPPTMIEHMSHTRSFYKIVVQEHSFYTPKDSPGTWPRPPTTKDMKTVVMLAYACINAGIFL